MVRENGKGSHVATHSNPGSLGARHYELPLCTYRAGDTGSAAEEERFPNKQLLVGVFCQEIVHKMAKRRQPCVWGGEAAAGTLRPSHPYPNCRPSLTTPVQPLPDRGLRPQGGSSLHLTVLRGPKASRHSRSLVPVPILSPHLWKDRGALASLQVLPAPTCVCRLAQGKGSDG